MFFFMAAPNDVTDAGRSGEFLAAQWPMPSGAVQSGGGEGRGGEGGRGGQKRQRRLGRLWWVRTTCGQAPRGHIGKNKKKQKKKKTHPDARTPRRQDAKTLGRCEGFAWGCTKALHPQHDPEGLDRKFFFSFFLVFLLDSMPLHCLASSFVAPSLTGSPVAASL